MTAMANHAAGVEPGGSADARASNIQDESTDYFVFPLSPQQKAYLQADRAIPGNPAYNGAFRHELTGPLDAGLWQAAWNELVGRHEGLRASVRVIDGRPVLAIAETMRLSLVARDLLRLPVDRREAEMERTCIEDARHRFDLENGPLIRVGLIRLEDERYVQTLTLHHIVCDGWSIGILMDELPAIYAALVERRASTLPDLEIQFGDYLAWLDDHLNEPAITKQIDYWTGKLEGYQRLDLEPDLVRPRGPCIESDIVSRALPDALIGGLRSLGNELGGTLFTTGLAAVMALMWRETGREDVAIGTPVAGRDRPELEKLVGPLVNYIVIRADADGGMSFRALEAAVREAMLEAFANQNAPIERIVDALGRRGRAPPEPFYSISFVSQRAFAGGRNFTSTSGGVTLRTLPSKSQGALHDLFFFLVERENGWRLSLDYCTELFSAARAEQLLGGLIDVLERIATRPDVSLGELEAGSTLDAAAPCDMAAAQAVPCAQDEVTAAAAEGSLAGDAGCTILPASFAQERFWLLSRAAPENSAFNMPAALRISGLLDARRLEASLRRMIARHEILRTGFEEVDGKLSQVIAPAVVFDLAQTNLEQIPLDQREARLEQEIRREGSITFDLSHPPLVRGRLCRLAPEDHLLVLTLHDIISDGQSLASLQNELWATYDALSENREPELPDLDLQYGDFATWQREWVESESAKAQLDFWTRKLASPLPVLDFPLDRLPSHGPQTGVGLRVHPLPGELVARLKQVAQAHSATMFAVTGAAFAVLLARYTRHHDVLFGSPVANRTIETETMLGRFAGPMALRLDLAGDPTLLEVLTRGRDATYEGLGNASYPFERLLEHIDARAVDGRNPLFQFYFLYQLAFLQEQRTKTLRIEPMRSLGVGTAFELQLALIERPTGVEAQLEYNPAMLDAVTVQGVLAYYAYVLEALVGDPTRKVSSLKEPEVSPESRSRAGEANVRPAYVAARTDGERRLVAIWERLLRVAPIGIHDDFFQLGGQSILAARLVVAIEKEFEVRTSISTLAWARTIAQLAGAIAAPEQDRSSLIVPMNAAHEGEPLFLVHCGGGHVLRYQHFVSAMPGDQPILGISAPPIEEIEQSTSVESLARRYIGELRKVQPSGPYRIGGYSFGGLVAFEMAAQLRAAGEQIAMLAIFDTANPSHYRDLPSHVRWKMRVIHLVQVADGYLRLLLAGNFSRIAFRVTDTYENYARKVSWRLRQLRGRLGDAPVQRDLKDFMSEFALIGSRYAPPPLAAGAVLFHADQRGWEYRGDRTLGWEKLVKDGVTVRYVPGDHESLMQPPHAGVLAETFVGVSREVSGAPSPAKSA